MNRGAGHVLLYCHCAALLEGGGELLGVYPALANWDIERSWRSLLQGPP